MARKKGQRTADEDLLDEELEQDDTEDDDTEDDGDGVDSDEDHDSDDEQDDTDEGEQGFDEAKLMRQVESRIDRRLNAVLREIRKGRDGSQQKQQSQRHQKRDEPETDVRAARLAYREYVADEIQFTSSVERQAASRLANGLISERIASGVDDEDEIGSEVAREVAKTISDLRKHYGQRTRQALRKQGLLKDPERGQGGAEGKGRAPQVRSEMLKGSQLAAQRHGLTNDK